MANNRIYYAIQGVRLRGPSGTVAPFDTYTDATSPAGAKWDRVRGLQTVGINTNFNLEPVYQMGQLELYDNYEEVPEVEVTLNKVFDGFPTIYEMSAGTGTLTDVANNKCGIQFAVFPDTNVAATGTPGSLLEIEPAYVSTATFTFNTDGNFTEDVTLVANDKVWLATENWGDYDGGAWTKSPTGLGIARRQQFDRINSVLPSGTTGGLAVQYQSGGIVPGSHISSITITANLNREQIRELGQRRPYLRYINFPVEITCEIQTTAISGDLIGVNNANTPCANPKALSNKQIVIKLCDGTTFDLGTKNKLTTVNYAGGDTGGGNSTVTYSYRNFNDFKFSPGSGYGSEINDQGTFSSLGETPPVADFFEGA